MAFTKTALSKNLVGYGKVQEIGTWLADGGTASGTITANPSSGVGSLGVLEWSQPEQFSLTSNGGTAVIGEWDPVVMQAALAIVFTANDSGTYSITGPAA